MRILYAIQGTGNGHLARALDMYPALQHYGQVDVLVSGVQADITLPFPVKYRFHGLSFIFGKHGGIDKWATFRRMNLIKLITDILRLPVQEYDLVISDFEPVSSWACKLNKKPCIALSHQHAVLHPDAPKPKKDDLFGRMVLKHYAPSAIGYGFHFKSFADNIFTPVIRREIREAEMTDKGHYTVYLPSYDDNTLVKELSVFSAIEWQVFSKHCSEAFSFKNIHVQPIENSAFIASMASSKGVLCGAGFETPSEVLYMGKKLMVIPMSGQYEQQCNAACLAGMQVAVVEGLNKKNRALIADWLDNGVAHSIHYPDRTDAIIGHIVEMHWAALPKGVRLA
ncbi:MAG TPA: glycosyltransferase family protein [Chitinophagaceae bacterium]|nr:glycosyltransferase family protein [Chitinophagaceae bacterium]